MSNHGDEPAYPVQWQIDGQAVAKPGMTLREHYAGLAMQGLLAGGRFGETEVCDRAINYADELIRVLSKAQP
jgi:hypothetical protein